MLRPSLLLAAALAGTTAVHAEVFKVDYRVDYTQAFEHLTATATDLTGQSATGTIVFDTADLLSSTNDGVSQTVTFAAQTTWSAYAPFPVPPSNDTDTLSFTLYLSGGLAGTAGVESQAHTTWSTGPLDHDRIQTLNANGTFSTADPAAPTAAELLAILQSATGTPGAAFGNYKLSTADGGTQSYTDLVGSVTFTGVTAVPEPAAWPLALAGLAVAARARRRGHARPAAPAV